jgi:ubiquitin carboxyl-terminal hydrolase 5/13
VKTQRISVFPRYLTMHLRRYIMGADWTPRKLDALVPVPRTLDLEALRG